MDLGMATIWPLPPLLTMPASARYQLSDHSHFGPCGYLGARPHQRATNFGIAPIFGHFGSL
jgi:hypothetical protein